SLTRGWNIAVPGFDPCQPRVPSFGVVLANPIHPRLMSPRREPGFPIEERGPSVRERADARAAQRIDQRVVACVVGDSRYHEVVLLCVAFRERLLPEQLIPRKSGRARAELPYGISIDGVGQRLPVFPSPHNLVAQPPGIGGNASSIRAPGG